MSYDWQDIGTAPECELVRLLLDDGREAAGEYWPAPPIEIDPQQVGGGWAICLVGHPLELGLDADVIGDPTHWQPYFPKDTPNA